MVGIKIPRNGGPLICFKHNVLIDMLASRRTELNPMQVGRLLYNEHTGFEHADWGATTTSKPMITGQTRSFYRTAVVLLRSCLRDGKRMEAALKRKNTVIAKLEAENLKLKVRLKEYEK